MFSVASEYYTWISVSCGTCSGLVSDVKADPSPLKAVLRSRLPLTTTLQCVLIGRLPSHRCRGMQVKSHGKAKSCWGSSCDRIQLQVSLSTTFRPVLSYSLHSLPLGMRLEAAFQCRPLKLDFLGVAAVLMLPSLGGNDTNPAFLTTAEILPAAPKQLSQCLHIKPPVIWRTVGL